jgi:hypothetical protein
MFNAINSWWRDISIGKAPAIISDFCCKGKPNSAMKSAITKNVTNILLENKKRYYKFGKTGHSLNRSDYEDYRSASYEKMYLLYESKIPSFVEFLEKYYSAKYKNDKFNKNIDTNSLGTMKSIDGNYYLYLVV